MLAIGTKTRAMSTSSARFQMAPPMVTRGPMLMKLLVVRRTTLTPWSM
jgi:hypothetical protein